MKYVVMTVLLAAGSTGFAADPQMDDMRDLIRAQQQQIELLQQQLDVTRESLHSLSERVEENAQTSVEANEKAEILADNIDSQPAWSKTATTLGGYGELHATMLENQATGEDSNSLDLHRFVLFIGHNFNDRLRFISEVEIEHAVSGGDAPGEVEIEQACGHFERNPRTADFLRCGA